MKEPVDKIGKAQLDKVLRLKYLRHKAWQNARQQKQRAKNPEYKQNRGRSAEQWRKIAEDYTCEIKAIQKGIL